jgi:dienelactone hydrolase
MAQAPHELEFVVEVPFAGTVSQHADFDVYRPEGAGAPLPAVIIVPGPSPAVYPIRPTHWPVYQGYSRLVANRGVVGVILDQPFHAPSLWAEPAEALPGLVESVRELDGVDADRIAVWAFSGGALLVGEWLAKSPEWLRCLALTYPLLNEPEAVRPGRPLVLTRVGRELPERQVTVDRFLATGVDVRVVDVPDGQHGFDVLDHTEQSRHAVLEATDLVLGHLS